MIKIKYAKKKFKEFTAQYDKNQEKIKRKTSHSYNVSKLCKKIARHLKLEKEDIKLAELIGLLHDIGRFEQAKQYNDFRDAHNFDHADYGADWLFKEEHIRDYILDNQYDEIIEKAIRNHNKLAIEQGLAERELLFAKIIRDADKIDILRLRTVKKNGHPAILEEKDTITDEIYNEFMNNNSIVKSDVKTNLDQIVLSCAFIYDLNYKYSYSIICKKDYINKMIKKYKYENKDTMEKLNNIAKHISKYTL